MTQILTTLFLLASIASSPAHAMVNGTDVASESDLAKSTVVVLYGMQARCGATVIGPRHLITAAHCTFSDPRSYYVVFTTDVYPVLQQKVRAEVRTVTRFIRHPEFRRQDGQSKDPLSDDLAILELNADVPEGTRIAKLPESELQIPVGSEITTLGYGLRNAQARELASEPIRLAQKTLKTAAPEKEEAFGVYLNYHRLFVRQPEGGICQADSGGPTYLVTDGEPVLVAVNGATVPILDGSAEQPPCAANAYVSRLDTALEWIRNTIKTQP